MKQELYFFGGGYKKKSRINSNTKFIILLGKRKLKRSYPIKITNNDEKLPHK